MDRRELAGKILDEARKRADEAEVYWEETEALPIAFEANELKSISSNYLTGVGLRVFSQGRVGFSSTTASSDVDKLVSNAMDSARYGLVAQFRLPSSVERNVPSPRIYDEGIAELSSARLTAMGEEIIAAVTEFNPEIHCNLDLQKEHFKIVILNSAGLEAEYKKTVISLLCQLSLVKEGDILWVFTVHAACGLERFDASQIASELIERITHITPIHYPETRPIDVIFSPDATYHIFDALSVGINGKQVQKGSSPLAARLGEVIFDERLTIEDDGTLDFGVGSSPVDGEGVASQKTLLVDGGVLKGFIFDLQTAGAMEARSTGNGGRGFASLPVPVTTNLIVQPGHKRFDEMVKDTREGILVYEMTGAGQSNVMAGEFAGNVSLGLKIEKGEIVGRVKDTMIAGNVYDLLKDNLVGLSKERRLVEGRFLTPGFHLRDVSVVGKR